jgi:hypothetical protein
MTTDRDATRVRASAADYERVLDAFGAKAKTSIDCVRHLQSLGFTVGQARNASYRYRQRHGLVSRKHREKGAE